MRTIPEWLKKELPIGNKFFGTSGNIRGNNLHTVCESANCPNKWECYSRGTATFLLMGDVCTRNCGFCGVSKGDPLPLDGREPARVARLAKKLLLKHVVVTSVTRDDLTDGGAGHFVKTIAAVKKQLPKSTIEVLTPDFCGSVDSIGQVLAAKPDIFAHNIEMVPRLYSELRSTASYERSLVVLHTARKLSKKVLIKSGIMVGLGETDEEVLDVMKEFKKAGVDILTIGQYLQPKLNCHKVANFIAPNKFKYYYLSAKGLGIKFVFSGPHVRSSYRSEEVFQSTAVEGNYD